MELHARNGQIAMPEPHQLVGAVIALDPGGRLKG